MNDLLREAVKGQIKYLHSEIESIGDRSDIIKAMFYLYCFKVQFNININNHNMSESLISFQYYFLELIYLLQLDFSVINTDIKE